MRQMRSGKGHGFGLGFVVFGLIVAGMGAVALADDAGQGTAGAARLSSVEGQVRLSQGGQVIADPAVMNAPLFAGTRVETGDDGKAEIQFDDGSVARLSPDSALTLTSVGGQSGAALVLEGGLGYFELQGGGQGGQMRVTFGDSVVTATGFTVMRIRMDNPPGEVAVFSGNAHVERGNSMAVDLHGGESVALNANDPSQYNLAETIEPDSWDAWNTDRDQALNAEAADQTGAANNFVNNDTPIRRGTIWTPMGIGTTFRGRGISGRRMRLQTPGGILMETATGCGRRATVISLFRAIHGGTCPTSAECGTITTVSDGAGRRAWVRTFAWAAAIRGGVGGAAIAD